VEWLNELLQQLRLYLLLALKKLNRITNILEKQDFDSRLEGIEDTLRAQSIQLLKQALQLSEQELQLATIVKNTTPPPPSQPAGFRASLTLDQGDLTMMALKKAATVTASLSVNDDGTMSVNVEFTDTEGLDITTYTAWPTGVALVTAAFSDATPGPSSGAYTAAATIVPSTAVPGALVAGSIAIQPPLSVPPPAGWGQNVDVQISIASGLTNQTAPVVEDAGTYSVTADASKPSGFVPVLSEP